MCMNSGIRFILVLTIAALFLISSVTADNHVGGIPLRTVADGVVSGGLYHDGLYGMGTTAQKSFTIPDHTGIQWAHLYVVVYCGNMRENYQVAMEVRFDGDGDGTYERTWNEHMNSEYGWPGDGGSGPVDLGNGNRVTSDYLYWYDVSNQIKGTKVNTEVLTSRPAGYTGTFDGRIKLVALVVAYDDGTQDQIYYQVNQGHDVSSYYDELYVGQTEFDLPSFDDDPVAASLSVIHLASVDGKYWINGEEFEGRKPQGAYSGWNQWNVLDIVSGAFSCSLEYQKAPDATSYKIPIAMLSISYPEEEPKTGEISVESVPSGAWIILDGVNTTKKTPSILSDIHVGEHNIAIKLEGYRDASKDLTVVEDDVVEALFELERAIPTPSSDGGGNTPGTGYHGGTLALYQRGEINGTLSITTAGTYTGLLDSGKGDENVHIVTLPENATVHEGRLYVYTTWGHNQNTRVGTMPTIRVMMDGYNLPLAATYGDRKGDGTFDYLVNTFVFDLDERITSSGNYSFSISNIGREGDTFALYGSSLLILAEAPDGPEIEYWISEGCDAVLADPAFGTTPEDATTTAFFDGIVDVEQISQARLIAISTAASGLAGDPNRITMNDMEWINRLTGGSSEISYTELQVSDHVIESENTATIQSYADDGGAGDYMENRHLIFVIQKRSADDDPDDPSILIMPDVRPTGFEAVYAADDGRIQGSRMESGIFSLLISEGSRVAIGEGSFSSSLLLLPLTEIPDGGRIVPKAACQIEPLDGVADIPIILMATGDESSVILRYDQDLQEWAALPTHYDSGSSTVSTRITNLGLYGVGDSGGLMESEESVINESTSSFTPVFGLVDILSVFSWNGMAKDRASLEEEGTLSDYPEAIKTERLLSPEVIQIDHSDTDYSVMIRSNPPGALIHLDGEYLGTVTPYMLPSLPSGFYVIGLSLDGFSSVNTPVDLTMDTILDFDLPVSNADNRVLKVDNPDTYAETLGGIYIHSRPNDAEIYLDGRRTGRTTPQALYGVSPGTHTIRIRLKDVTFPVEEKSIWVYPGEITPVSFFTHDEVYTRTVSIDNPEYRELPFSINGILQAESIPAEVDIRGLNPYITVYDGSSYLSHRLTAGSINWDRTDSGTIFVESTPSGAAITLDGFSTGLHTPARIQNISAGLHHITISKPGHLPEEAEFWMTPSIHDGDSERFSFSLERYAFGTLRVDSNPPGARIYLYGQNTGLVTPHEFPYMYIGKYSVRLTGKGWSQTIEATVTPFQATEVYFKI